MPPPLRLFRDESDRFAVIFLGVIIVITVFAGAQAVSYAFLFLPSFFAWASAEMTN